MAVLLTQKRKILNIVYTILVLLSFILIPNLRCGGETAPTLLDGWTQPLVCIYFISLTSSCLAAWIGTKTLSVVFALPHFIFLGCSVVMIFMYDQPSLGMVVIVALAVIQIANLLLFYTKDNSDIGVKYVLTKKEILLNIILTILLLVAYYYAKSKYAVFDFDQHFGYYRYNLFSTFFHEITHGNIFELLISFVMFFAIIFVWLKKYRWSFGVMMVFALGSVVAFFYTLNCWARTNAFNVWAIFSALAILCSIVIFKVQQPKKESTNVDIAKLEILKEAGVISEKTYQKKLSAMEANKETKIE